MSDSKLSVSTGPTFGLGSLIFIIFLVLKLANVGVVATWSWWWVTCPLWISAALTLGILLLVVIIGLVVACLRAIFGH